MSATVPPPDHTASRLTDDDLDVIRRTAAQAVADRQPNTTARRLCAHAMGCSLHDLRDTELAAIDRHITEANEKDTTT